ncbi:MAG: P-loop containing nucleoside triphosphate hydrolase protein [Piptocephalis tieghemiana]|nr:MAG: P-loop containing nucleoside triphosphate hydrolase protein [Piptocephalis tieghemiana]
MTLITRRSQTPAGSSSLSPRRRRSPPPSDSSSLTGTTSSLESKPENVRVLVRVRPASEEERAQASPTEPDGMVWQVKKDQCISLDPSFSSSTGRPSTLYSYDSVISNSENVIVYDANVKPFVRSVMEGVSATVLAYGQTASGKTYTMSGKPCENKQPGIIGMSIADIFSYIREQATEKREYLLRVSYLEVYNETIRDLLSNESKEPRIMEDKRRGVYLSPLREEIITSPVQVMGILRRGEANRHISATESNERSSRSHTILQIIVESRKRGVSKYHTRRTGRGSSVTLGASIRFSQLNLIDLAGSEKPSDDEERRREATFINKSLLALGNVIHKLTEEDPVHIPYRDSKLTRILQPSLSGNARIVVICTLCPTGNSYGESVNTLRFAQRLKKVTTAATTNRILDDKALLQKYRLEIMELKARLLPRLMLA